MNKITINIRFGGEHWLKQIQVWIPGKKVFTINCNELRSSIPTVLKDLIKEAEGYKKIFRFGTGEQKFSKKYLMSDYLKIIAVSKQQGNKNWIKL